MIPFCKAVRKDILNIAKASGHGHIPTCFSIVEILYAVYNVMAHDPSDPQWKDRDLFILSKGHASLAHYVSLAHLGYFPVENVYSFGSFLSDFGCHADRLKVPGVEASTGSLGHGIGIASGMALSCKITESSRRIFVLIGDGESNEGSVWEAILVAVNQNLNNLTIIYDNNMSHARGLQIQNPAAHFRGFGCDVVEVPGHDVDALQKKLEAKSETVRVIVANTVKGYGCKTLTNDQYAWHRRSPNDAELEILLRELDAQAI
jgi:transketolase